MRVPLVRGARLTCEAFIALGAASFVRERVFGHGLRLRSVVEQGRVNARVGRAPSSTPAQLRPASDDEHRKSSGGTSSWRARLHVDEHASAARDEGEAAQGSSRRRRARRSCEGSVLMVLRSSACMAFVLHSIATRTARSGVAHCVSSSLTSSAGRRRRSVAEGAAIRRSRSLMSGCAGPSCRQDRHSSRIADLL